MSLLDEIKELQEKFNELFETSSDEVKDLRTKNEKGMEATRKRSDHGASYRDYINHRELYPHNQGITGDEEKDLKKEAKDLYQAIDHYNTWNKEHGYNPHPGSYITGLKSDFNKVRDSLKSLYRYKRNGKSVLDNNSYNSTMQQILDLTEAYQALLEGHNLSWVPLRALLKGKISGDKYDELNAKAQAIPSSNDMHKKENGEWDTSNLTNKSISSVRSGELSTDIRHIENGRNKKELEIKRKNDEKNGYPQATAKAKKKHKEKMNDNNSYNSTMQQILDLTESFAALLEAQDARGGAQKEVNKITRTKKDKNGEPIEVVSVADELFPYKGTAKEQYNQKILAKINDMIEGTATLDDLIQLVRSKKPAVNVKESLQETLDKMMAVTETIEKYVDNEGNTHELEFNVNKDRYHFGHKINGKPVVSVRDSEPNASYERKHAIKNYGLKKVESLEEAISLMEAFLNEKNANVEKKHQWEINQAQAKRPKDEYVGDLGTVSGIKKSNQGTIYGLKRILKRTKNSKYSIGRESDTQALESGISKVAGISRDALGRKEPENPYKVPYMWCKAYETTHGNLNQKAIERNHSYDQGYKKHLQTSIEQEKKIKPKLPKPKPKQEQ